KNLVNIPHKIIIPGAIAYTFLKPQPKQIPLSLLQQHKIHFPKELLKRNADQVLVPLHSKLPKQFSNHPKITQLSIHQIPTHQQPIHIPPKTIHLFTKQLQPPHTLLSNPPIPLFQFTNFPKPTIPVSKPIPNLQHPITIIGG
ncbi:phosphoglycerate kinase, partial [Staphylococcus hominis]|uniref:phosphoglycerate kinase n=1 Tax=Staphylococcus hominis TaxID=1290 RepID=UPI0011A8E117